MKVKKLLGIFIHGANYKEVDEDEDEDNSEIKELYKDLYDQLNIKQTKTNYKLFVEGWEEALTNINKTSGEAAIDAPKTMEEFSKLCQVFKQMLEKDLRKELDINFVRGYCYCLCFFMPNK